MGECRHVPLQAHSPSLHSRTTTAAACVANRNLFLLIHRNRGKRTDDAWCLAARLHGVLFHIDMPNPHRQERHHARPCRHTAVRNTRCWSACSQAVRLLSAGRSSLMKGVWCMHGLAYTQSPCMLLSSQCLLRLCLASPSPIEDTSASPK